MRMQAGGVWFVLRLGASPLTVGREGDLPEALLRILDVDDTVSRRHFDLWIDPESELLYIRNYSGNGLEVDGRMLAEGDKARVRFNRPLDLVAGKTRIRIEPE